MADEQLFIEDGLQRTQIDEFFADEQGFDGEAMTISHVAPHKVGERQGRKPRAFGTADPWNTTLCDVELIIEQPEEDR